MPDRALCPERDRGRVIGTEDCLGGEGCGRKDYWSQGPRGRTGEMGRTSPRRMYDLDTVERPPLLMTKRFRCGWREERSPGQGRSGAQKAFLPAG